ncbi:MAG: hypothetical protein FD124_1672 [Alphaproteobacteria bacterium]|nr:MAG: hypothetical protein FD160_722 [Caulobacteraceae bacterium]TPW06495.1 MAG: hypothetical protein FD124_1672 [Alphaproteobacteria bacterium]
MEPSAPQQPAATGGAAANRPGRLPDVNAIGLAAPFRWLGGAWGDMAKAPLPCLLYGAALGLFSYWLVRSLYESNAAFWVLALTCGFVFVAPMLAMGLYEAGRMLEKGEKPTLPRMLFVGGAVRQDVAYLGLALLLIYLMWGRIAQLVYGLSTYRLHRTVADFIAFALNTGEGHNMLISGTIVGGIIAFFTYCLAVVSTPMLLDRNTNVFAAMATSFRAVTKNFIPMLLWALIIVALVALSAATWFAGFVVIFPLLGLASWRAYRDLVAERGAA